jgi:arylsulfatase A-like enzyme
MNAVLVSIDSLRADAVSCYGSTWVDTPHLDRLADDGILFENTVVQTPHTIPSHASMLTGLYPFNHGLRKDSGLRLSAGARTLFDYVQAYGYETAAFLGNYVFGSEYGYTGWNRKGRPHPHAIAASVDDFTGQRFFMFIHTYDLHVPYCTILPAENTMDRRVNALLRFERSTGRRLPAEFRDKHIAPGGDEWLRRINKIVDILVSGDKEAAKEIRQGYKQSVEQIDRWLGEIVTILENAGVWNDTLLIVTADHGDCFNEHGEMNANPHWSSIHGAFLYDNVLKVPLLIRIPGGTAGAIRVPSVVESVDIAPTICELLKIGTDPGDGSCLTPDGTSLLKAMAGNGKQHAYSETLIRENDKVSLHSGETKLIIDNTDGSRRLYDVRLDPGETIDLRMARPGLVPSIESELRAFLARHRQETAEARMTPAETALTAERLRGLGYID